MAKTDIKDAFRIIPIHLDDLLLLGVSWHGVFYHVSPWEQVVQIFESLSQSLEWAMFSKFNAAGMSHMLDIFFSL